MLLNIADQYYFVNDANDWAYAGELYQRLILRLSFLQKFTSKSALAEIYDALEYGHGLTIDALSELQMVYNTAVKRRDQLRAGKDMFGNGDMWVPRLVSILRVFTLLESCQLLQYGTFY
jgi:hypothetical protein